MAKRNSSGGGFGKFFAILLALIIGAGAVCAGVYWDHVKVIWGKAVRFFQRVDDEVEQEQENDSTDDENETPDEGENSATGGGLQIETAEENGISLAMMPILASDYEENGISNSVLGASKITASIQPTCATNKSLNWSISFTIDSHTDTQSAREWLASLENTGETISDFVRVTPSENGESAIVECFKAFGCPITLTVSSEENPNVYANAKFDFQNRIERLNFYIQGSENFEKNSWDCSFRYYTADAVALNTTTKPTVAELSALEIPSWNVDISDHGFSAVYMDNPFGSKVEFSVGTADVDGYLNRVYYESIYLSNEFARALENAGFELCDGYETGEMDNIFNVYFWPAIALAFLDGSAEKTTSLRKVCEYVCDQDFYYRVASREEPTAEDYAVFSTYCELLRSFAGQAVGYLVAKECNRDLNSIVYNYYATSIVFPAEYPAVDVQDITLGDYSYTF